ncbi:MAG: SDR family NAD(P)-dependent oxidoreductase [Alphaproteobacteria bacterium]|nr:SDR family NAD(P)-dependent oxidoreductase [Alphaproteobacteria bacterium]
MTKPLEGRIALVTGASRGIGYAAAKALAADGAHVIAVARTVGGLEELDDEIHAAGGSATLAPLDLREGELIDRLGGAVAERWGRLDILVGNAGILGELSPMGHQSPQEWDKVLAVNLTANWRLIRSFDTLLRASDAGRALFLTSTVGHRARAYWGAYAVSKAGLEMMVRTYADELGGTAVRVNLLNPGATRTAMRAQAMPGEDPATLPAPDAICPAILRMVSPAWQSTGEVLNVRDRVA